MVAREPRPIIELGWVTISISRCSALGILSPKFLASGSESRDENDSNSLVSCRASCRLSLCSRSALVEFSELGLRTERDSFLDEYRRENNQGRVHPP